MAATVSLSLASCAGEDPVGDDPDSENVTGGGSGSEDENGSGNENTEGGNEDTTDDGTVSRDCTIEIMHQGVGEIEMYVYLDHPGEITVSWYKFFDSTGKDISGKYTYVTDEGASDGIYYVRFGHEYGSGGRNRMTIKGEGIVQYTIVNNDLEILEVDVSQCETLETLNLNPDHGTFRIEELDLSHNRRLRSLRLESGTVRPLDFSSCKNTLESLNIIVSWSSLFGIGESLDLSGYPKLKKLVCNRCGFESLNLQDCVALEEVNCRDNKLTSLNIKGCESLTDLDCSVNPLSDETLTELIQDLPFYTYDDGRLHLPTVDGIDWTIATRKGWWVFEDESLIYPYNGQDRYFY